jgi:DNA-binding CsgD family transcriptional regulator
MDLHAAFATVEVSGGHNIAIRDGLHDDRWDDAVIRLGRGLGGRVLHESQAVRLGDYLEDTTITGDYRPIVRSEGMRSIACVPVVISGRVESLLYVALDQPESMGDRILQTTCSIAELTGLALKAVRARTMLAGQARQALRTGAPQALRDVAKRIAQDVPTVAPSLTARELEVLDLLAAGASDALVARRLGIAISTAKEHAGNLRRKLGATSRLDAVARARAAGLL